MEQNNNPQNEIQQTESEKLHTSEVEIDREKIDRALDFFLQEQENAKEREKRSEQLQLKKKRAKRVARILSFLGIALFVLLIIILNPETKKQYKTFVHSQTPLSDYTIEFNYSPDTKILPMGANIAMYDSSNLRLLQKDGSEIFDIPFTVASWDMATSDNMIYLLDKIEKLLYFIDSKGSFVNKVELSNMPEQLYAGRGGNLIVRYRSESGVEGIFLFEKDGKLLEDLTYPKTTLTLIKINDNNVATVHGMYRIETKLSNYVYRYSAKGKLIFSKTLEDMIVMEQFEHDGILSMVDINRVMLYEIVTNEVRATVDSLVPVRLTAFDSVGQNLYCLDNRNRLRIIDMKGQVIEERFYQTEYKGMILFKGKLVLLGEDYVRTASREQKYPKPIENAFIVGDYLALVMKGEIRLSNKMD